MNRLVSKEINERWKNPFSLLAVLFILIVIIDSSLLGIFENFDHRFNDGLMRSIAERRLPSSEIVMVDIDEKSLEQMAVLHGRYPWPRSVHAELIEGIELQHPRAILIDIIFADPDRLHPDADSYLAEVASQHDNLYFPYVRLTSGLSEEGLQLALPWVLLRAEKVMRVKRSRCCSPISPWNWMAVLGRSTLSKMRMGWGVAIHSISPRVGGNYP